MPYRFATDDRSYADLASGRVLRSRPGQPAFPVRLAREMFEQALALRPAGARAILYDPCCGAGHLLTTVGLLYADRLAAIVGSDADAGALAIARENLRLLEPGGLQERAAELEALHVRHQKPAHREAMASARALAAQAMTAPVRTFQANALDSRALREALAEQWPQIVLADAPYGRLSAWSGAAAGSDPAAALLDALGRVVRPGAVVAIATSKEVKVAPAHFVRRRQLKLGKRRVTWLVRDDSVAATP